MIDVESAGVIGCGNVLNSGDIIVREGECGIGGTLFSCFLVGAVSLCGEIRANGAPQNDQKSNQLNFLFFHFISSVLIIMSCVLLSAVRAVSGPCCIRSVLYPVRAVFSRFCTQPVLHPAAAVSSLSCIYNRVLSCFFSPSGRDAGQERKRFIFSFG